MNQEPNSEAAETTQTTSDPAVAPSTSCSRSSDLAVDFFEGKLRSIEKHLVAARKQRDEARKIAEMLWQEIDFMAKRYVGKRAPSPPALPWKSAENA
jgi:hypothetical protein